MAWQLWAPYGERREATPADVDRIFHQQAQDRNTWRLHGQQLDAQEAEFRDNVMSGRRDVRRRYGELLAGPAVVPQRKPEKTKRVRVVEGFSTEWNGLPVYAGTGAVIDAPSGLVAAASHLFQTVDENTPLHQPAPLVDLPR
jgi:hypothetical protein